MNESNVRLEIQRNQGIDLNLSPKNITRENYEYLTKKPSINGVTLIGDKSSSELNLEDKLDFITEQEIDEIIFGGD